MLGGILFWGIATPSAGQETLDVGLHASTFSAELTRGYWFTSPTEFFITALRVPIDVGLDPQNIQVVRFGSAVPVFSNTTDDFTTLGYWSGVNSTDWISTNIAVGVGDLIGIIGARGTTTMHNSYTSGPYASSIFGHNVELTRLGVQMSIAAGEGNGFFTEPTGFIGRIEMQYGTAASVPEPASMLLLGTGLVGVLYVRTRRRPMEEGV